MEPWKVALEGLLNALTELVKVATDKVKAS